MFFLSPLSFSLQKHLRFPEFVDTARQNISLLQADGLNLMI